MPRWRHPAKAPLPPANIPKPAGALTALEVGPRPNTPAPCIRCGRPAFLGLDGQPRHKLTARELRREPQLGQRHGRALRRLSQLADHASHLIRVEGSHGGGPYVAL